MSRSHKIAFKNVNDGNLTQFLIPENQYQTQEFITASPPEYVLWDTILINCVDGRARVPRTWSVLVVNSYVSEFQELQRRYKKYTI